MSYIDKTYTDSYEEYKDFKDWADKQVLTFFNGHKEYIDKAIKRISGSIKQGTLSF